MALAASSGRAGGAPQGEELHYRHTVFFNFKADVAPDKVAHILDGIRLQGKLPYVKGFFMGKNSLPKLDIAPFQWLSIFDFANESERKEFLKLDAHLRFIHDEFFPVDDRSISTDIDQPLTANISDIDGIKVRQVGLFNFKEGLSQQERDRVLDNIRSQARLPHVRRLTVGPNILPRSDAAPFEWLFMSEFASEDDNKAFRASPEHQESEKMVFEPARSQLAVINVNI